MSNHTSLPGFRDFYPAEFAVRAHIMSAWREAARRHGFEEYDGPPLEQLELYVEKSGDEIVRQLYSFEDKGGRAVAMRPEMTPSLARMVGARASSLRKPIRWFSMPQLFRYERMQRGRLREHFQWNVDIIGEDAVAADAEVLATGIDGLRLLGLTADDIVARFNDRRLLEALLTELGVHAAQLHGCYVVIDKLGRDSAERIRSRLADDVGLDAALIDRMLALFDVGATLDSVRLAYGDRETVARELARLDQYTAVLGSMGLADFIRFDTTIVRGLAYYTGTVFEIFDRKGELRAVCGGGRYDNLLASVSGQDLPGVGFGMGDVVLGELLRDRNLLPDGKPHVDAFLIVTSDNELATMLRVAAALRRSGISVMYAFQPSGIGRQLKEAAARGAVRAVILGPEEVGRGMAVVRRMDAGEQAEMPIADLLEDRQTQIMFRGR